MNTALGIGAISSSVSTCSGSVNVPANCVPWADWGDRFSRGDASWGFFLKSYPSMYVITFTRHLRYHTWILWEMFGL